jgi:hypothetical protein
MIRRGGIIKGEDSDKVNVINSSGNGRRGFVVKSFDSCRYAKVETKTQKANVKFEFEFDMNLGVGIGDDWSSLDRQQVQEPSG